MLKISQPRILTKSFLLYQMNYIIQDSEGDIWFFKERLDNGSYPHYTLSGKTLGAIFMRSSTAYIHCKFLCRDDNQEEVSVLIEDIVSKKKRKYIGSWLINRLIEFLRSAERIIKIDKIYGHFLPNHEEGAENFYRRFGFDINIGQNNRKIIIATMEDLKTTSLPDIKEISVEDVVKDWFKNVKG